MHVTLACVLIHYIKFTLKLLNYQVVPLLTVTAAPRQAFRKRFPLIPQMIDSRLAAQRREVRIHPADAGLLKTSTYIVPCFLLVEVS